MSSARTAGATRLCEGSSSLFKEVNGKIAISGSRGAAIKGKPSTRASASPGAFEGIPCKPTSNLSTPRVSNTGVATGKINFVHGSEILDSRGNPTVKAEVCTRQGLGSACAPSGASTGIHEALELRDNEKRYFGKGARKAARNVNTRIAKALCGMDVSDQKAIDKKLCALDGTKSKSSLGANAVVAASLAAARCAADEKGMGLYGLFGKKILPAPMMNVINGGKHAQSGVALQEFMVFPLHFGTFSESLRAGAEVYRALRALVGKKYGGIATAVGDEGGFAPPCRTTEDALCLLEQAISECGYAKQVKLAIDAAASSFYDSKSGLYHVDGKGMAPSELSDFYASLCRSHPIVSLEDPFEEEAFSDFASLKRRLSGKVQVVGDDLTVTSLDRLSRAYGEKSISALLLKVNQVGTLTEALEAAAYCQKRNLGVVVSHRSGETCDSSIADIAVGIGCGQIKAGAPCRGERVAKYNRLLEIEEELSGKGFAGASCLRFG